MSDTLYPSGEASVLVLQGGGALGSYQAGIYEALAEQGRAVDWVAGISIGAINAALIAGNPPERRVARLREFWDEATQHTGLSGEPMLKPRQYSNALHALLALAWGRPAIFRHRLPGLWSALPWMPNDVALFDHAPLRATLNRLVDFERLNGGETRLTVGADCDIRENVTMNTGTEDDHGLTEVGNNCFLMVGTHIGHERS